MRVTHLIAATERGGGSDHVASLVEELGRLGVENRVITSGEGPLAAKMAASAIPTGYIDMMRSRVDIRVLQALRRSQLVRDATVVHAHGTRAAFFARAAHLPSVVYTVHGLSYSQGGAVRRPLGLLAEWVASGADEVICVAQSDLESLHRRHLAIGRGTHIANGVDTTVFAPASRLQARRALGLDEGATLVGTVSRLVPQKGVDVLIRAVEKLDGVTLLVVGDGPLRPELEEMADTLDGRVRFLGTRDDVAAILPALDVFALSSRWEGEPMALLQAMACALPCVATATGGARELLGNGRGLLVAIDDPAALSGAIQRLLADGVQRDALSAAARSMALTRSWGETARATCGIYRHVADVGGDGGSIGAH
jgi:glycosyltransferase involved in cell wall biosynthesis